MQNVGFLGADILMVGIAGALALSCLWIWRSATRAILIVSWYALLSGAALVFLSLVVWATASRSDDLVAVTFVGVMVMSLAGVLALASQSALGRASLWTLWVAAALWLLLAIEAALLSGEPEEGTALLVLVVIPFWTLVVVGPLFGIAMTVIDLALFAQDPRTTSAVWLSLGIGLLGAAICALVVWLRGPSTWTSTHLGIDMVLFVIVGGTMVFLASQYVDRGATPAAGTSLRMSTPQAQ